MLLSAVSVLVVAQSISEIPEGLMNNPVFRLSLCKPHACALSRLCQQLLEEVSSVPSLLSNRAAG